MAIITTAGSSGTYTLGAANGSVTLATAPATANAIFIVTLTKIRTDGTGSSDPHTVTKFIVGPSTIIRIMDSTTAGWNNYTTVWHYVQMVIS